MKKFQIILVFSFIVSAIILVTFVFRSPEPTSSVNFVDVPEGLNISDVSTNLISSPCEKVSYTVQFDSAPSDLHQKLDSGEYVFELFQKDVVSFGIQFLASTKDGIIDIDSDSDTLTLTPSVVASNANNTWRENGLLYAGIGDASVYLVLKDTTTIKSISRSNPISLTIDESILTYPACEWNDTSWVAIAK